MKHHLLPLALLFTGMAAAASAQTIAATATGLATAYSFTVQKAELCTVDGSSVDNTGATAPVCGHPFTVGSGTQTFNLGDSFGNSAGASVGSYAQISGDAWQSQIGKVFRYIRVTLFRLQQRKGVIALTGPSSGFCSTGLAGGDINTAARGYENGHAPDETITYFTQPDGTAIGADTTTGLYQKGQKIIDADFYTQMIPLTSDYTATGVPPTIKIAFDLQTALQAAWVVGGTCAGTAAGTNTCCMYNGDVGVTVTFQ